MLSSSLRNLNTTHIGSRLLRPLSSQAHGSPSKRPPNFVNIVEVGPRDGLQNEKAVIPVEVKVELINRLVRAGMSIIEAGSFVSPKWVPQMAGTAEVITRMERLPNVHYPVLVPNARGLDDLLALLASHRSTARSVTTSKLPPTDEISIFASATDAFSKANTNCTIAESLERLAVVSRRALDSGLRVRGYVSVVITCPYSGKVDYKVVRDVSKKLLEMGCYEVSLGDTNGTGTPGSVKEMLEVVLAEVPVEKLAGHFHDTYGTGLSNVLASLSLGIRTIDASVGGLGGCPYSPGATGNVATEDVLHALQAPESGYEAAGNLEELVKIGTWISEKIGKDNASRAGKAYWAQMERRKRKEEKEKAKL